MSPDPNRDAAPNLSLHNPNGSAFVPVETLIIEQERLDSLMSAISEITYPYVALFADQLPAGSSGIFDRIRRRRYSEFTTEKQSGSYRTTYDFKLAHVREEETSHLEKVVMSADSTAGTPFNLQLSADRGPIIGIKISWDHNHPRPTALSRLANPLLADFLQRTYSNSWSWEDASLDFNTGSSPGVQVRSSVAHAGYEYNPGTDSLKKVLFESSGTFESADDEIGRPEFLQLLSDTLALIPTQS